jgi:hypothetical protein
MTPQQQHAREQIKYTPIGHAFDCASQLEIQHKVATGTYGSLAILDQWNALQVLTKHPLTVEWLEENDPKALEQARTALGG